MSDQLEQRSSRARDGKIFGDTLLKSMLTLLPGIGGPAVEMLNGVQKRREARASETLEAAVQALGIEVDHLCQMLFDDEHLGDIWTKAASAAASTDLKAKRRVYARIMAETVNVTRSERVAKTAVLHVLQDLDEEHLEVLVAVKRLSDTELTLPDGSATRKGVEPTVLSAEFPHTGSLLETLVASLFANALIRNTWEGTWGAISGQMAYRLAPTGEALARLLEQGAEE